MNRQSLAIAVLILAAAQGQAARYVLPRQKFTICGKEFMLEMASHERARMIGLMNRTDVPEGTGMLFSFAEPSVLRFWMRNVPIDLDIAYFSADGKLVKALTMKGTSPLARVENLPSYSSEAPAQFAVEAAKDAFKAVKEDCRIDPVPKPGRK